MRSGMHKRGLFVAFVLLLTLYGLGQYWLERQRRPDFESGVLLTPPGAWQSLKLSGGGRSDSLFFTRSGERWIVSSRHRHLPVSDARVQELFAQVGALRTLRIVGEDEAGARAVRWSPEREVNLVLTTQEGQRESLHLLLPATPDTQTAVTGYLRLAGAREIYAITGLDPRRLQSLRFDDFRAPTLLQLDPSAVYARIVDRRPDTVVDYRYRQGQWWQSPTETLDSFDLTDYLNGLKEPLAGRYFADDFDETAAHRYWVRGLRFYTHAGDSVAVNLYRDSLRALPLIWHGSQFPRVWIADDSSVIYPRLLEPLDRLAPSNGQR